MSFGVFKLSAKQRRNLSFVFNALNAIQALLGLSITITSIYIIISVAPVVYSERSEVNFVFIITGIYGTHVTLHYLLGMKICNKCLRQPHKKSTSSLFLLWICGGCNILLNFIIVCAILRKVSKHIIRTMKHSMQHGMRHYLKEEAWKLTIDKLQYQLECCGTNGYQDWYELEWLTKYHINMNAEEVKKLKTESDTNNLEILPWSCCKIDFPMQCLHDPVQQTQSVHIWTDEPTIMTSSINTEGCLKYLRAPIERGIVAFIVTTCFIVLIQVLIFFISRVMYTSARNAVLLADPDGVAPGWFFGRGDCGYTGGKSIAEIMAGSETTEGTTETSSRKSSPPKTKKNVKKKGYKKLRQNPKKADLTTTDETTESNPETTTEAATKSEKTNSGNPTKKKKIKKKTTSTKKLEEKV